MFQKAKDIGFKKMTSTKQIFLDLSEDYHQILGSSTNLIEAIKERDKRIKDLELQIETINKPLTKI